MTLNSLTTDKPVALGFQIELEFGNVATLRQTCGPRIPDRIGIWKCYNCAETLAPMHVSRHCNLEVALIILSLLSVTFKAVEPISRSHQGPT